MAVGTNVKSTQALKLVIYQEATMGNAGLNAGATRYQVPLLSPPSILDLTAPLEASPTIIGHYAPSQEHAGHNRTGQMIEISFSVLLTPTLLDLFCLFLFEDGDGTNELIASYSPPTWGNNGTDDSSAYSVAIDIGGGGYTVGDDWQDIRYTGCIAKSMTINHAVDNEAGKVTADMVFVTGYIPQYHKKLSDDSYAEGTPTLVTGASSVNFTSHTLAYLGVGTANYMVFPYSYSITATRDIVRVGCANYSNYKPDGYVMNQGEGWDVTMNMAVKRDENWEIIHPILFNSALFFVQILDGANWNFYVWGKVMDSSVDTGGSEIRNNVTIKGMRNLDSATDPILHLAM